MNKEEKCCNKKCKMCENRNPETNFCIVNNKDCCSIDTDFSQCKDYLINSKLAMF